MHLAQTDIKCKPSTYGGDEGELRHGNHKMRNDPAMNGPTYVKIFERSFIQVPPTS